MPDMDVCGKSAIDQTGAPPIEKRQMKIPNKRASTLIEPLYIEATPVEDLTPLGTATINDE
jgi:hypothetical protein